MKLHLPKRLLAALIAAFAVHTTVCADEIISVNFGSNTTEHVIKADATDTLKGESAGSWNNIVAENSGGVTGEHSLKSQMVENGVAGEIIENAATLILSTTHAPWGPGGNSTTLTSQLQAGYLDCTNHTLTYWTIDLDVDHMLVDFSMYFSGDGGKYNPITVNGQNYIGGTDQTGDGPWGNRDKDASATLGDHNTITVTNIVGGSIYAANVASTSDRSSISGFQVVLMDLYESGLESGSNSASALTFSKGGSGTATTLENIDAAERYLGVSGHADNTSTLALNMDIKGLQLESGTVSLTSAQAVERLHAKKDAVLNIDTAISGSELTLSGQGQIYIGNRLTLDKLVLQGGAQVTIDAKDTSANSTGMITGVIEILGDSMLTLGTGEVAGGWDHLGWGNGTTATDKILLRGVAGRDDASHKIATLKLNSRQTCSTPIVMEGYASVIGNGGTSDNNTTDKLQLHDNASITASGIYNTISCEFNLNKDATVTVTNEGDWLEISGKMTGESKLTKLGDGTLIVASDAHTGGINVNAGTLKFSGDNKSTTNNSSRKITVQTDATLDVNGKARHYEVVLHEGATLTNTGDATGNNQRQLHTITMEGDATVSGTGNFYLINNGYTTTYLNLNQHMLTKTGSNTLYLKNTTVQSAGVIRVEGGTVQTLSTAAGILDISKASLEIADAGSFVLAEKSQQIQNLTLEAGGTLTINSGLTLTTMGDVTWNGGAISGNLCLNGTVSQTGGTVDLSNAVLSGTSILGFTELSALPQTSGLYGDSYKLIDGETVSVTSTQTTITVGGKVYNLNTATGIFSSTEMVKYYVAAGDTIIAGGDNASADTSSAEAYTVAGTLNIAADVSTSYIMAEAGRISVTEGKTLTLSSSSLINTLEAGSGRVTLEEGTLILGNDSAKTISSIGTLHVGSGSIIHLNSLAELRGFAKAEGSSVVTIGGSGVFDIGDARNMFTYSATSTSNQTVNSNQSYFRLADDWTGTVRLNGAKHGANDKHLGLNLNNLSNAKSAVELKGVSGFFTGTMEGKLILTNLTVDSDEIAAWTVTNGNTSETFVDVFNGAITGAGTLRYVASVDTGFKFAGEMKDWSGTLDHNSAKRLNIYLEGAASNVEALIQKSGSGALNLKVNTTAAATFSRSVTVSDLELSQSATFTNNLTASTISVASDKTLTLNNGTQSLAAAISGAGGLIKAGDGTLTLSGTNTYRGSTTISGGEVILTSASALSSGSYTISKDTKLTLKEANYSITNLISGEGELVVEKGTTLTLALGNNPDGKKFGANIRIKDGGRLQATDSNATDQLDYDKSRTVYLEGTAELALEDTRQTVGNWTFDMTGGTISGRGVSGNLHALDFHKTGSIKAHAAAGATADAPTVSTVSASIKNRENGQLNLIVDENARLDLTGNLNLARPVEKSGDGLAVIKGTVSSLGEMKVTAGTLELQSSANTGSALTVSSGAEFEISAGTSTLSGAVTNNGAITVSGGSATLSGAVTNNGAMTVSGGTATLSGAVTNSGSITVSSGSVDFTGAFTANAANASLTQSGTGVVNLNGDITVATGAGLTLNGVVGIGSTITNNGTLTFTNSITIAGELSSFDTYDNSSEGQVTYVGIEGNARLDGNGFEKVSGLSYWLTSKDSTGTVNYGDITHVSHGSNAYTLNEEGKNLYFTVESNIGSIFFVKNADEVAEVSVADAAHATGFDICNGGSLSLAAGAETNANATIRLAGNSSINLAAGSTLHTFAKEGSGTLTLTGSGTYDLGSGVANLGSGISLGSSWTGTVRLSDVVASGMDFETYGNAASKVALNGVSGYFDRSTNNNVHIILEKKGLTFSDFSTDDNYTFVKGISGAGNFIIDAHDRTDKPVMATPTIRIGVNEDASLTWSGKFQVNDIRTDSASNPGEAFVRLYLNGNGSYFDSTAASAGVEMNDSVGTLKVFVGHATSADNAKEDTDFTPGDGLTTINGFVKNNSTGRLELTALNNTVFNKEVDVTSMTVNRGKTATMNTSLKAGTLKLGDTATITKAEGKDAASMQNVKLSEEGIASADETKATKGSVTDAKVTLAALAAGTSFSIEDVTLRNVNIEAANAGGRVNLSGLSASDVQLTKGEFHMLDKAQPQQVGMGGSPINLVEGGPTGLDFSTSLLNGMTLGVDASMVVDLGDLSGFTGMDSGKPTFSITLTGFSIEGFKFGDFLAKNPGIYFAADSWLGQLLAAQGASQYVGDTLEAGTQATAGTGSGVGVIYTSTDVGTVIIISGLQVPEPTTTSLSLLALSALAMRRRRK